MTVLKRILVRLVVAVAVVATLAAVIIYVTLTRSLAQLDGNIAAMPVTESVTITRDASGIPTIVAGSRNDLAFATGFVHAQDRFFQMDLMRRQAAGELAALAGAAAVELDKRNRLHRFRDRAKQVVARAEPQEADVIAAYTAGVNAGLEQLGTQPFEYYLLRSKPNPWSDEDSILVALAMFMELNDQRATRDIQRGLVRDVLPPQVFAWMYPDGTEWDAPMQGQAAQYPDIPDATLMDISKRHVAARRQPEVGEAQLPGSNNWAVSGELTEDGRALVANDMHLNIRVPNTFYRARLQVTGQGKLDLNGVTLPGTPVMITGSNGSVAWAFTNSYGDWSDAVVLQPGATADSYQAPDGPRDFDVHRETIEVRGEAPVELVVRETIWGPVLDGDGHPQQEMAVSWIAHSPDAVNLGHLNLEQAQTVEEAMYFANRLGIPPQNFVTGDAAGNIGWTIAGKIPRRADYDSFLPADWSNGHGWLGWLDPDEYPRIYNPPGGRIWTANARVVAGQDLRKIRDGGYDLGARARQIRDGLQAIDKFAPQSMLQIQTDDRAIFLERWRELLLTVLDAAAVETSAGRREYRELVQNWTPRATAESSGYRLVRAFRSGVRVRVFDMLTEAVRDEYGEEVELRISNQFEAPLWSLVTQQPRHLLSADYASWADLLLDVVDENLEYYFAKYSGALADRTWGERNTAAIRHPLSPAVPPLARWLDMRAEPLDGDHNMPRAQGPAFGASERFAVSPGAEADGLMHMPTGQSGHPLSRFYRKGHDDWVSGRAAAFLPGGAQHTLTLNP